MPCDSGPGPRVTRTRRRESGGSSYQRGSLPMRRLFPVFIAAVALLAGVILFTFIRHGDTAHTQPVPEAGASAR